MFTEALFTIAKTWKQPKCPQTEEWVKKLWYIYAMKYYSAIKKKVIVSEVSQTEKDKYMILLICGILKMVQIN